MYTGGQSGSAARSQRSTLEVVDALGCLRACGIDGGDEDPIFLIQAECTTVKQLVM
jgi:hypothetical protein